MCRPASGYRACGRGLEERCSLMFNSPPWSCRCRPRMAALMPPCRACCACPPAALALPPPPAIPACLLSSLCLLCRLCLASLPCLLYLLCLPCLLSSICLLCRLCPASLPCLLRLVFPLCLLRLLCLLYLPAISPLLAVTAVPRLPPCCARLWQVFDGLLCSLCSDSSCLLVHTFSELRFLLDLFVFFPC